MTRITCALSGFNPRRVLGSGTALDTARLRYLLGEYLGVDPRNIHAYVMGEHGDSEFVPWSQAFLATKSISQLDWELESSLTAHLLRIEEEVRTAAYKIIEAKKSTYYGIGMALTRITKAILGDEHSVLTVSAMLRENMIRWMYLPVFPALSIRMGYSGSCRCHLQMKKKRNLTDLVIY